MTTHPRRRWFHFGLRALLIALALLASAVAWVANERRISAQEMEIAGQLRQQRAVGEVCGPFEVLGRPMVEISDPLPRMRNDV